jgi:hypothetical protein
MIPVSTSQTIHTSRHIRTMRSILTSTGPAQDRWPRLRETEQIQRTTHRLQQRRRR